MAIIDQNPVDPAFVSMRPTALRIGLIWGGSGVIISLLGFLLDMDPAMPTTGLGPKILFWIVSWAIIIVAMALNLIQHRDQELGGYIQFSRCLGIGALSGLIAGVFSFAYFWVFTSFINPEFYNEIKNASVAMWETQGMSDTQIETALGYASYFWNPWVMGVLQLITSVFLGFLFSFILGFFVKRERPIF